ncbi:hypothetical protein SDC9_150447 [bioreactor metagenome]|uniref:Uncharacterized protein n=1 Tax=bioreactor metagenome TaxID=1076179 RepID=A0A645EMI1_9ZZZZ
MKNSRFSKILVTLIIVMNVAFTIYVLEIFKKIGSEPSTLILSWFGFTTGELLMLSSIKKKKITSDSTSEITDENQDE